MIAMTEAELVGRLGQMWSMFTPLRDGLPRVACDFAQQTSAKGKVWGAHDGTELRTPYRSWSFRTHVPDLRAGYFEVWRPADLGRIVGLNRAYLTLLRVKRGQAGFDEVLCVHCDPDEESRMKCGPHLHVKRAEEPLPHCHFPLNLGHLDGVLAGPNELTLAMRSAIEILAEEVLPRFRGI